MIIKSKKKIINKKKKFFTKKTIFKGGGAKDDIKNIHKKIVNDTYIFFEQDRGVYKEVTTEYLFSITLKGTPTSSIEIKEKTSSGNTEEDNIYTSTFTYEEIIDKELKVIETFKDEKPKLRTRGDYYSQDSYNPKSPYNNYELYYPNYHGAYIVNEPYILEDNVYLCFFGLYHTSSITFDSEENKLGLDDFFTKINQNDFEILSKYKAGVSFPEINNNFYSNDPGYLVSDCLAKASWIFPGQIYYDMLFSIHGGHKKRRFLRTIYTNQLTKTYHSKYHGGVVINKIMKNKKYIDSLKIFIDYIVRPQEEENKSKKFIIYVDACRPDMIPQKDGYRGGVMPEVFYKNHTLNLSIYKKFYGRDQNIEEFCKINELSSFICSSDTSFDKHIVLNLENATDNPVINYNKNDNLHNLIFKIKHIYDIIISHNTKTAMIQFVSNHYNEKYLSFITMLSFNKLKKFLIKIKNNISDEPFNIFLRGISEREDYKKTIGYYNEKINKFVDKYSTFDTEQQGIFSNFKIAKYLIDYLDSSEIIKGSLTQDIKDKLVNSPLSYIFGIGEGVRKKYIKDTPTELYLSGYYFGNPLIKPYKATVSNLRILHIYDCPGFQPTDKLSLNDLKYTDQGKLIDLKIDDTGFSFADFNLKSEKQKHIVMNYLSHKNNGFLDDNKISDLITKLVSTIVLNRKCDINTGLKTFLNDTFTTLVSFCCKIECMRYKSYILRVFR